MRDERDRPFTDLDRQIVIYFDDPTLPQPTALGHFRRLGENRMLVEGGLLEQPAGLWYAQQRAGYLFDVLTRASNVKDWFTDTSMSADDLKTHSELVALRNAPK